MAVYIITGKLGAGKTLIAVGLIQDALRAGRKVATNVDLWLENLITWKNRSAVVYRLPDQLSAHSFDVIGLGNEHFEQVRDRKLYDEGMNGLIVLDEGGLSMNSRDFREEGRKEFIKWCIHSRKRGWDVAIVVQHFDSLDKQIRDMFGEHIVYCLRFDRMAIPFIGWALQLIGLSGKGAKVHMAVCKYGQRADSPVAWRKVFKGADLYFAYDTRQQYFPSEDEAVYQLLPPWHLKGRYEKAAKEWQTVLSDLWRLYAAVKVSGVFVFFCAMALGGYAHARFSDGDAVVPHGRAAGVEQRVVSDELPALGEVSINELVVEPPVDPWSAAWLSRHVRVGSDLELFTFRNLSGEKLHLPKGAFVRTIDACHVAVHIEDRRYQLTCRPPG